MRFSMIIEPACFVNCLFSHALHSAAFCEAG